MASVRVSGVDPQTKIIWPDFDPYLANGLLVVARIDSSWLKAALWVHRFHRETGRRQPRTPAPSSS